jgi:hypothetical protein
MRQSLNAKFVQQVVQNDLSMAEYLDNANEVERLNYVVEVNRFFYEHIITILNTSERISIPALVYVIIDDITEAFFRYNLFLKRLNQYSPELFEKLKQVSNNSCSDLNLKISELWNKAYIAPTTTSIMDSYKWETLYDDLKFIKDTPYFYIPIRNTSLEQISENVEFQDFKHQDFISMEAFFLNLKTKPKFVRPKHLDVKYVDDEIQIYAVVESDENEQVIEIILKNQWSDFFANTDQVLSHNFYKGYNLYDMYINGT